MSRFTVFLLFSLVLTFSAVQPSVSAPKKPTEEYEIRIKELMSRDEMIMLRSAQSEFSIGIPISARMQVDEARLDLRFTNSISLKARSQLTVALNGSIIAQLPLKARNPETRAKIRLPLRLLAPGYNKLTFGVAQHYTDSCEDPSSPELWTQIDTEESVLRFKAHLKPLSYRLNDLAELIDRKLWSDYQLNIMTAVAEPDNTALAAGALAAQGAALLLDYVPLVVEHGVAEMTSPPKAHNGLFPGLNWAPLAGRDTILVGTHKELEGLLSADLAAQITDGFLGIYPNEADPSRFLLLISGVDAEDVQRAAQVLAVRGAQLPDLKQVVVRNVRLPKATPYFSEGAVTAGQRFNFADLGLETTTLVGMYPEPPRLRFWIAPDHFSPTDAALSAHIHLAYGAGLGAQSTLNVFLNGRFEHAVHLTEPHGAVYYDYVLNIPVASLQPGWNELEFRPNMLPENRGGECQPMFTDNLLITLFDDSYLEIDRVAHFAKLPDLRLLARTGFPYTVTPDGTGVAVQMAGHDSATIGATWTLLAKLAQVSGQSLLQARIGGQSDDAAAHLIVVGQESRLDATLKAATPSQLSNVLSANTAMSLLRSRDEERGGLVSQLMRRLSVNSHAEENDQVEIEFSGEFDNRVAALQFESPFHSGKSVLLLTATRAASLGPGLANLVQHKMWGQLQSGVVIWSPDDDKLQQFGIGSPFYLGDAGLRSRLGFYFSDNPVLASLVALAVILVFVLVSRWLLIRFRRKHHPNVDENA